MPSPKYPLKPLLEHRERKVDDRAIELGQAIRSREVAEEARARAEAVRREAELRAAEVKASEAARLERGELRAVDLARGEAWALGAQTQIAALAHVADAAKLRAADACGDEARARTMLATDMADRDVVAKDAARFAERSKQRMLAAEEEAAEEAFRPRGER